MGHGSPGSGYIENETGEYANQSTFSRTYRGVSIDLVFNSADGR